MAKPKKEQSDKPADDAENEAVADRPKRKVMKKKKDDDFVQDVPKKKPRIMKDGAGNHVEDGDGDCDDEDSSDDDAPLKSISTSPRAKLSNSSPAAKVMRPRASTSPKPAKKKATPSGDDAGCMPDKPETSPKPTKIKADSQKGEINVFQNKADNEDKKSQKTSKSKAKKVKSSKDTEVSSMKSEGDGGCETSSEISKKSKPVKPKATKTKKSKKVTDSKATAGVESAVQSDTVNLVNHEPPAPAEETENSPAVVGSKKKEKTDTKSVKCKRKPKAKTNTSSGQDIIQSREVGTKSDILDTKPKTKRKKSVKKVQEGESTGSTVNEDDGLKPAADSEAKHSDKPVKTKKRTKKKDKVGDILSVTSNTQNVSSGACIASQSDDMSESVHEVDASSCTGAKDTKSDSLPLLTSESQTPQEKPIKRKRKPKKKEDGNEAGDGKPTKVKKKRQSKKKVVVDGQEAMNQVQEVHHAEDAQVTVAPSTDTHSSQGTAVQEQKGSGTTTIQVIKEKKLTKKSTKSIKSVEGAIEGQKKRKRKSKDVDGMDTDEKPPKVKKPRAKKKKVIDEAVKSVSGCTGNIEVGVADNLTADAGQVLAVSNSETTNIDMSEKSDALVCTVAQAVNVDHSESSVMVTNTDVEQTQAVSCPTDTVPPDGSMKSCEVVEQTVPASTIAVNAMSPSKSASPSHSVDDGSVTVSELAVPSSTVDSTGATTSCAGFTCSEITALGNIVEDLGRSCSAVTIVPSESVPVRGDDFKLAGTQSAVTLSESVASGGKESSCLSADAPVSAAAMPSSQPVTVINGVLLKPSMGAVTDSTKQDFDVYDLIDEDVQLPARPSGCDRTGILYPRSPKGTTVLKSDEVRCERCGLIWPTTQKLLKHLENCKGTAGTPEPKRHKCRQCEYQSKWTFLVRKHEQTHGIFACQHCEHLCQSDADLRDHIQKEHPNKKQVKAIKCSKCLAKIATDYKEHLETCPGKKVYMCSKCNKTFKFECRLAKHMLCHETEKRIKCELCEFRTNIKASLAKHVRTVHKENKEVFICPECNKSYASEGYLKRHRKIHTDASYACETCGKSFKLLSSLKGHITEVHNPPEQSICDIEACGQVFDNRKLLKLHQVESHQIGVRKFSCTFDGCGHVFYKYSHLKRHQATHTGERKFKCDWPDCGKAFRHADNLKVHYRQHTNEKPFKCTQCDFACRQKSSLQWHLKRRHLPEGEPAAMKGIMPSGSENSMTSEGELTESDKTSDSTSTAIESSKPEVVPKKKSAKKIKKPKREPDKTSSDADGDSKPKTVAKKSKKAPKEPKKEKSLGEDGSEVKKKKKKKKVKKSETELVLDVAADEEATVGAVVKAEASVPSTSEAVPLASATTEPMAATEPGTPASPKTETPEATEMKAVAASEVEVHASSETEVLAASEDTVLAGAEYRSPDELQPGLEQPADQVDELTLEASPVVAEDAAESCSSVKAEEETEAVLESVDETVMPENSLDEQSSDSDTLVNDEPPKDETSIQDGAARDDGNSTQSEYSEKPCPNVTAAEEESESAAETIVDRDDSSQQSVYAADDESQSGSVDDRAERPEMAPYHGMAQSVSKNKLIGGDNLPPGYKRDMRVLESPISDDEEEVALRLPPRPADSPTLGASRTSTETSQDSTSQEMLPPSSEPTSQDAQLPNQSMSGSSSLHEERPVSVPHEPMLPPPQPQQERVQSLPPPPYSHHQPHFPQPSEYESPPKYADSASYPPHRPYKDLKYPPTEYPDMEANHLMQTSVYYNDSSRQVSDVHGMMASHNGSADLSSHVISQQSPTHQNHEHKISEQLAPQNMAAPPMNDPETAQMADQELPQLTEQEMMPHIPPEREMPSQLTTREISSGLSDEDMAPMSNQDMPSQLASQDLMSSQDMPSRLTNQDLLSDQDMPSQLANQDMSSQLGNQDMPPQLSNQDLLTNQDMPSQQLSNQEMQPQLNNQEMASHIDTNSADRRSHPPPSGMPLPDQSSSSEVRPYDQNAAAEVTEHKAPSSGDYVQHESAPTPASGGDMNNYGSHDSSATPHSISYIVQPHDADRSHVYTQPADTSLAQSAGRNSSDECNDAAVPASSENAVYRDPMQTSMSDHMHSSKPSMYTTSESHDSLSHMQSLPGPANIISSLASMVRDPTHSLLPSTPPTAGQYLQPQFPSMTDYHRPMSCMPSLPSSGGTDYFNQFMPDCGNLQPPSSSLQSDRYNTTQSSLVQPPSSAMSRSDQTPSSFQVLQQGTSAEFLRRASVSALTDRNYTSPALLNSTGHQPAQWIGQESSRHWTQPSPLSLTPDLSTNSPLTKDPFFDTLDPNTAARKSAVSFGMSASREAVSDAMGHPHHLDMASMYMAGRYVTPAAAAAAANANYQRHVTPSSGKPYDDTYRTTHMPDYRSLPQAAPPAADMFRVGMNPPPLALDKYNYARDFMYRSQHIGGSTAPFMSQTASSQMNPYQDRDFARSAVYPQSSPYAFMGADKQYLSSRTKLGAGMPGISDRPMPNDYFPGAPPPPTASAQDPHHFQDPYRRSIYNMMNRYFE